MFLHVCMDQCVDIILIIKDTTHAPTQATLVFLPFSEPVTIKNMDGENDTINLRNYY